MATMRAVRIHRFGGPDVLALDEVPVPTPGAGELLVKVRAASLNPVDHKTREGKFPPVGADKLPIILGRDIAGTVAGGAAGGYREGDAVFAMLDVDQGGYTEYVLVRPEQASPKPARLDFVAAAAVPLAGLTAWQGLLEHGQLQAGQCVLVHGGAGGVGHLAVQFAKARGATVYATAAARDLDFMAELGVDGAIDYQAQRFEDVAQDIDLVYDLIGGETQARSLAVLKRGGRLVSTLTEPPQQACAARGITGLRYMTHPDGRQLGEIGALIEQGMVRVIVAESYPMARAAAAQERLHAGGVRGKLVLEVA
jgi:NADPH:quinone reductase-like Zn-dependent oxidoreductase